MPHCCGTGEPWIDEYGESAWRRLVLRSWRGILRGVVGGKGEEKGGVSVEMLDRQRHDVEWMVGTRSKEIFFPGLMLDSRWWGTLVAQVSRGVIVGDGKGMKMMKD